LKPDPASLAGIIDDRINAALKAQEQPGPRIEILQTPQGLQIELPEVRHPKFEMLAKLVAGQATRIWLTGPAGTGKTHAIKQIAESLGRPLYLCTPVADKYELTGYTDAHGNHVATQMYQWAVDPNPYAILNFDEFDGNFPQPLVAANAALANGWAVFPGIGIVEIAKTKKVLASLNTTGSGATLKYPARFALDGATIDRFFQRIHWDLHEPTERLVVLQQLPYESTEDAIKASWAIRRNLESNTIDLSWGPRCTIGLAQSLASGLSLKEALSISPLMALDSHAYERATRGVL
jgi:MoxR-like ATPase